MIMTFIPLTVFALLIISLSSFFLYSNSLQNSYERLVKETLVQVNFHLDTYLNDIVRLTHSPYYNDNIMKVLENNSNLSPLDESTLMDKELYTILTTLREDIQGVYFYRNDGTIFSKSRYRITMDPTTNYIESDWFKNITQTKKEKFFINELNMSGVNNRPSRAFSVARGINLYDQPSLAALVIDINYTGLENIIKDVDIGDQSNILILDQNNNLIMSQNKQFLSAFNKIDFDIPRVQEINSNNEILISNFVESNTSDWKIVGIVSRKEVFMDLNEIQRLILIIAGITILLIAGACIVVSYRITKPLSSLNRLMKEVKKGNYNIAMKEIRNDEIGDLARTFNDMKSNINQLVHQVLEEKFKQKEAELKNLKYQIRPHFLYNTLESIRSLAEIKGNLNIVEMSSSLGAFLRYSIKEHNNFVSFSDEINQVKNYVNIQQLRFGSLGVQYNLDPKALKCKTIPLILQPIVENAIQHGFKENIHVRKIIIEGRVHNNETIIITVKDNGFGIENEKLEQINNALRENNHDANQLGIGLKNVDSRIKMTFGEKFGLQLESKVQEGTTIILIVPYVS